MELDARRHLNLSAAQVDTGREPDQLTSPAGAPFRGRDGDFLGRIVPAGRSARPRRRHDPDPVPTLASVPSAVKRVLLVDPDVAGVAAIEAALRPVAHVELCTDFRYARARLLEQPPDLLITNLRLQAYNGLHLVLLAAATCTRCIVFSTHHDICLARDVQAAGAFFELPVRLPHVLESYLNATLPWHDRRDITKLGEPLRGGRRCTDH